MSYRVCLKLEFAGLFGMKRTMTTCTDCSPPMGVIFEQIEMKCHRLNHCMHAPLTMLACQLESKIILAEFSGMYKHVLMV